MLTKTRFTLFQIPSDAEFMLGDYFGKIVDGILFTQTKYGKEWSNTNKSLEEFNLYYEKEPHELATFKEIIKHHGSHTRSYGLHNRVDFGDMYVYRQWDGEIYISYYKPKQKGFKGSEKRMKYGAGESVLLDKEKYTHLNELMCGEDVIKLINGIPHHD